MPTPDPLLVELAAKVEREQSNQMSLTVVVPGAVITGRLAPAASWTARVAEVLHASEHLKPFGDIFVPAAVRPAGGAGAKPCYLHMHLARILQGSLGVPETGGMFRIAIEDVSSWTIGEFSYSG
jgi:hypothetical protein